MDRSFGANREIKCPHCDTSFDFKIWQIVDICERPDLLEKILNDTLYDVYCPECMKMIYKIDSPLLIFRPDQEPKYIYSSAEETVMELDQILFMSLMDHFKEDLPIDWPSNWENIAKAPVSRDVLSVYLREGPKAAEIANLDIIRQKEATAEHLTSLLLRFINADSPENYRNTILENYDFITSFRAVGYINEMFVAQGRSNISEKLKSKRDQLVHYREIGFEKTKEELFSFKTQSPEKLESTGERAKLKPPKRMSSPSLLNRLKGYFAHLVNGRNTNPIIKQNNNTKTSIPEIKIDNSRTEKPSNEIPENQSTENYSSGISVQPIFTRFDQIDPEELQTLTKVLIEDSTGKPKFPESEFKKLLSKLLGDYEASQDDPSIPKIIIAVAWVAEPDQEVIELTRSLLFDYRLRMAGFNNVRVLEIPTKITEANGKQTAKLLGRQLKADIVIWLQRSGVSEFDVHIEILTNHHLDEVSEENRSLIENDAKNLEAIQWRINNHEALEPLCSFLCGLAIFQDRYYPEAIDLFDDAIASFNLDDSKQVKAITYFYRGFSKLCIQDYSEAIDDFSESIKNSPDNSRFYTIRGFAYSLQHLMEKALEDFSYAIFLDPTNSQAYFNRGQIYSDFGKSEEAISDFSNCINNDPGNSEAYFRRGCEYGKSHKEDLAIVDFSKTIDLNPRKSAAYGNRGWAYNIKGDRRSAIEDYTMALTLDPNDEDTLSKRGEAYRHVGEIDKSIVDLNLAISLDPTHSDSFLARGLSFVKKGEITRAFADLDMAIQLNPQNADAIAMRGNLHGMMGDKTKAIKDLEMATKLNPKYRELLNSHRE